MKLLAQGPVMTEPASMPYRFVLRAAEEDGQVTQYVVHTMLLNLNKKGECVSVFYCHGHYFSADQKDEAYRCWARKVLERIDHNIDNQVPY